MCVVLIDTSTQGGLGVAGSHWLGFQQQIDRDDVVCLYPRYNVQEIERGLKSSQCKDESKTTSNIGKISIVGN